VPDGAAPGPGAEGPGWLPEVPPLLGPIKRALGDLLVSCAPPYSGVVELGSCGD
jgi:hypothetical protein